MVPPERIELSTSPLPRVRSTTELQGPGRPDDRISRAYAIAPGAVQAGRACPWRPHVLFAARRGATVYSPMPSDREAKPPKKPSAKAVREARLAAKLRQNLGRRKQQARSRAETAEQDKPERPR